MVMCLKWCFGLLFMGILFVDADNEIDNNDEVLHLIGDPDFRDVSLRWEYERLTPPRDAEERRPRLYGFQVHYCEIQAWGLHRCRTKVIEHPSDDKSKAGGARRGRAGGAFTARIGGLRMATTYTFEVRPLQLAPDDLADSQSIGKSIIVPTKGFSARATQCLPHASEVQVSTGPFFGGRIAVEAVDGHTERCTISGNPNSAQDTYTLRIDHEECGSDVNDTTVATYVIVQENLPILTHSTRRFLVLCTYKPETLTVRAGINLPNRGGANLQYYKPHSGSVEPFDSQEIEYNEVQPARLEARMMGDGEGSVAGPVVLVVFLVLAGFAAVALLIWRLIPQASDDNSTISIRSKGTGGGLFGRFNRRYQDSISDTGSIYSITLSDRTDYQHRKTNTDCDNTSEA